MTATPRAQMMRRSVLRAAPFQIAMVVSAILAAAVGVDVTPMLVVLLVPTLWAAAAAEAVFRSPIPRALQLHYLFFITAGPFAGSALNLYYAIPHWDKIIHFDSGIMLAWLGLLLIRRAEEASRAALPRWFTASATVSTPMAFGAAWEICEFASDALLGSAAQNGNLDTMGDIVAATVGGVVTLAIALVWQRPRSVMPLSLTHPDGRNTVEPQPAKG
jgi:uncharacterized membrane protein YjdF